MTSLQACRVTDIGLPRLIAALQNSTVMIPVLTGEVSLEILFPIRLVSHMCQGYNVWGFNNAVISIWLPFCCLAN
jgi:hypothetical protein